MWSNNEMRRFFCFIIFIFTLLSCFQSFAVDLSEENKEENLLTAEKLTDNDYAKFCTGDEQYTVQNLYTGESLTYNKDTPASEIKRVYTDQIDEAKKQTPIILYADNEYVVLYTFHFSM